jgi:betaine-aldehyde dehydrogenase
VDVSVAREKIFIDGEFAEGTDGEWRKVLNPATGEVIAEVPECSAEDVDRAVAAARRAFGKWFDTTPAERSGMLHGLADVLEENAEELAQLESRNVGKPIASARGELPYIVDNLRFFAGVARDIEGKSAGEYIRGYTSMIRREPVGVVGQIAPWNYPLMMAV